MSSAGLNNRARSWLSDATEKRSFKGELFLKPFLPKYTPSLLGKHLSWRYPTCSVTEHQIEMQIIFFHRFPSFPLELQFCMIWTSFVK